MLQASRRSGEVELDRASWAVKGDASLAQTGTACAPVQAPACIVQPLPDILLRSASLVSSATACLPALSSVSQTVRMVNEVAAELGEAQVSRQGC